MKQGSASNQAAKRETTDPVCGMNVPAGTERGGVLYKGRRYPFCAKICREAFEKDPERYLKPKGVIGRFLARMANANRDQFGSRSPSCCQ